MQTTGKRVKVCFCLGLMKALNSLWIDFCEWRITFYITVKSANFSKINICVCQYSEKYLKLNNDLQNQISVNNLLNKRLYIILWFV